MTTVFNPGFSLARAEPPPPASPAPEEGLNYWAFIVALFRAKHWIVLAGVAGGALALAVSLVMTPVFTSSTQILLKTRQDQVINIANVVDNPDFTDTAIVSELEIIRSPPILLEVSRRLDLASHPEFNPSIDEVSPIVEAFTAIRRGIRRILNPPSDQASEPPTPEQIAAGILADKVNAEQFGVSYILEIEATSRNPKMAAKIANTVAEVYIESQIADKLVANERATTWLSENEAEMRVSLQEAERRLEELRAGIRPHETMSPEVLLQQRDRLAAELVEANAERALAVGAAAQFDTLAASGHLGAAMQFATSPRLAALIDRRENALQQQRALERRGEPRTEAAAQIDAARDEIDREVQGEIDQLSRSLHARIQIADDRVADVGAQLVEVENTIRDVNTQSLDLRVLEREVEAERAVYDAFLNRLIETRERGDLQEPDARVVAAAGAPAAPSAPKRLLLIVLGGIVGGGLATLAVLLREGQREVFRGAEEAEAKTGSPVLAALPVGLARARSWMLEPPPAAANALNRLTALLDASVKTGHAQTIVVSSALPNEGAAELSVALANAFADDGARVALIDALPSHADPLKTLLAHQDSAPPGRLSFQVLRPMDYEPSARRRSFAETMRSEIDALRPEYDRIILCAAPVLSNPRVLTTGRGFDAGLLVFRWERTPQGALGEAVKDIRKLDIPLSGLVMTEVDFKVAAAYGYAGARIVSRQLKEFAQTA